jgi:hypothetical protein
MVFLILAFFALMSRIDYIVNGTLYSYGLRFSYDWAEGYWSTYFSVYVVFSIVVASAYWLGSNKTRTNLKYSIALFLTIILLAAGGVQDIMFFIFWAGGLPPSSVVWWWAPWTSLIGTWNSILQITATSLVCCAIIFIWIQATKKQNRSSVVLDETLSI